MPLLYSVRSLFVDVAPSSPLSSESPSPAAVAYLGEPAKNGKKKDKKPSFEQDKNLLSGGGSNAAAVQKTKTVGGSVAAAAATISKKHAPRKKLASEEVESEFGSGRKKIVYIATVLLGWLD